MTVRTRFAPSPTGSLHVGGARTALYCLLYARKTGGRFVLRIEDTDQARSTEESANGILRDLRWLALDWDEGPQVGGIDPPYFQSQRLDLYRDYANKLVASGHAYKAFETREELEALRQSAGGEGFRYRHRPYSAEELAKFEAEGRTAVLRLKAPGVPLTVADKILGDVHMPAEDQEDIVIIKADGFPTYHFAVVIDDLHMKITQILRGQEHLMNTPKHLGIMRALQIEPPGYGHLPLLFNPTGSKMSKRDKAKVARETARTWAKANGFDDKGWVWLAEQTGLTVEDVVGFMAKKHDGVAVAEAIGKVVGAELPMIEVMDFRKGGYLPEALLNYLALLGWNPGGDREIMSVTEMIDLFDLDRVNNTAARFDGAKLKWMNGEYMKRLTEERILEVMDQWLAVVDSPLAGAAPALRLTLLRLYRERAATFADLDQSVRYVFRAPKAWDAKAVKKHLGAVGQDRLTRARALLAEVAWVPAEMEAAFARLVDDTAGSALGEFAQPLRLAITGTPASPPLFDTLALFDRDEVLARIDRCLDHAKTV